MTATADTPTPTEQRFDYGQAFSRNIGWVTPEEQARLRQAKVAIAGLGGVGGTHLLTLVRLGIERFSVADFDRYSLANFNRQVGATMATLDQPKADTMVAMARAINPNVQIEVFPEGVTPENLGRFMDGVQVYVDGIDFFAMPARRMLFDHCHRHGIHALTAAPLGMGVALLYFAPGGMSFEDYFKLEGHPEQEQYARLIAGLSPAMLQRHYLAHPAAVNFKERRGPSTMMACDLCAGVMGTSVLKALLGRGELKAAPWGLHFDAYRQQLRHTWRPGGNSHPLQWLLLKFIRPKLGMG